MSAARFDRVALLLLFSFATAFGADAQENLPDGNGAEMTLHKSVQVREFNGQQVTGEERRIGRGDSLWRILIEEKGLSGKKFHSYLVVIRGLNPQVKNLDLLRVGEKVFIPVRPGDVDISRTNTAAHTRERGSVEPGRTIGYRVRSGQSLYRILREQFKLADPRELGQYASLVKDLNPQRKGDWDTLYEGEIIRLPALGTPSDTAIADRGAEPSAAPASQSPPAAAAIRPQLAPLPVAPFDAESVLRAPARANMPVISRVLAALGSELQANGEESIKLPEGTVHFDKSMYPIVSDPTLRQRVVLDLDGNIPASLKGQLNDPSIGIPVVPIAEGQSLQQAVERLLAALGYQPLPTGRPVVVQQAGIGVEAKGSWMALAPEVNNKPQDVLVISLTDQAGGIPNYLRTALAKQGLHIRDVVLSSVGAPAFQENPPGDQTISAAPIIDWPTDKKELVDAVMLSLGVPFGVAESLSVELRQGLRVDIRADRLFDSNGKRTALFFNRTDPAILKALEAQGVEAAELELQSMSSRALIGRMLSLLGEPAAYGEHLFAAAEGSNRDQVVLKAWGFNLPDKAKFVTDRQIPSALHRFFFEKGLGIVYFH